MMIDLEQLKVDREAGTDGPWWTDAEYSHKEAGCAIIAARTDAGPLPGNPTRGMVAWSSELLEERASICETNARRIARLPQLEAAYIEAVAKLDKAVEALEEVIKSSDQSGIPGYRQCWECADINKISKQALAAIKGPSHE